MMDVEEGTSWPPYRPGVGYDELIGSDGSPRPVAQALWRHLADLGPLALAERQKAADREIRTIGVTFRTNDGDVSIDRPWPYDVIPRVLPASEWSRLREGLIQRLRALNLFIDDVYHAQRAVQAGVVPVDAVVGSPNFRPECVGVDPPGGVWAHVSGSDLVRGEDGTFYVLEDNLRVPSGVSYLLENRVVTKHVLPELFRSYSIEPVDPYVGQLGDLLCSLTPGNGRPTIVVLTPGIHNAAYFEHAFLAQQLGVELVEGSDLVVLEDDTVYMRTVGGLERVDVIYRRVDDAFLDPQAFRRDSLVGVAGLMRAWRSGRVTLVNAPGAGVADDKAVYAFVPEIIRFFLGEDPILPNVPTWRCGDVEDRRFVLANLDGLVIKPANESGGYGIVIGPQAGSTALALVGQRIEQHPPGWVAQPVLSLSTMPTWCDGTVSPRHVDFRPFTLLGPEGAYVTPGGLTRVARQEGSLIVNSSQGGGSKDTWIVNEVLVDTARPVPSLPVTVPACADPDSPTAHDDVTRPLPDGDDRGLAPVGGQGELAQ
jgi:uncharacterized circularly permuted ATP-grasp superfamily protein